MTLFCIELVSLRSVKRENKALVSWLSPNISSLVIVLEKYPVCHSLKCLDNLSPIDCVYSQFSLRSLRLRPYPIDDCTGPPVSSSLVLIYIHLHRFLFIDAGGFADLVCVCLMILNEIQGGPWPNMAGVGSSESRWLAKLSHTGGAQSRNPSPLTSKATVSLSLSIIDLFMSMFLFDIEFDAFLMVLATSSPETKSFRCIFQGEFSCSVYTQLYL